MAKYFDLEKFDGAGFLERQFLLLPEFLSSQGLDFFGLKARNWLNQHGIRKDIQMPPSHTWRRMKVVRGTDICQDKEVSDLYRDPLMEFMAKITGEKVQECRNELERIILTSLEKKEDCHGRHLDTPPLALIVCLESPGPGGGGQACFTDAQGTSQQIDMMAGDAYVLRADLLPHQVLPLVQDGVRRTILNLAYDIEGIENSDDGSIGALMQA